MGCLDLAVREKQKSNSSIGKKRCFNLVGQLNSRRVCCRHYVSEMAALTSDSGFAGCQRAPTLATWGGGYPITQRPGWCGGRVHFLVGVHPEIICGEVPSISY